MLFCAVELDSIGADSIDVCVSIPVPDGPSLDIIVVWSSCMEDEGSTEESVACNSDVINNAVLEVETVSPNKNWI